MENYISAMQVVLMRGIRPETHFLCARIVTAAIPSPPIFSLVCFLLFINSPQTKPLHPGQASSEFYRAFDRSKVTQKTESDNALISLLQDAFKSYSNFSQ